MKNKAIVVTSGDPAGCGPPIAVEAINLNLKKNVDFILIGDGYILNSVPEFKALKKKISFIDLKTKNIQKLKNSMASKLSGYASLSYLNKALELLKRGAAKRLVTAPVSKEAVQFVDPGFCGHTEFLAKAFKVRTFAMMMSSEVLRVVLLTRHKLLRNVSASINKKNVIESILLAEHYLRKQLKIKDPRIAITSFNPHAGRNTFLEKEEKIIVDALRKIKSNIAGPIACDTLFIRENISKYHCIICIYHDQAMIPFKLLSLRHGVNVTLGLPIIRTSPAHGVAYDLIAKNKQPFSSSMEAAIKLAIDLSL